MIVCSRLDVSRPSRPARRQGGRRGGLVLLVVLVLLVLLGAGIGYMLYQLAGITP